MIISGSIPGEICNKVNKFCPISINQLVFQLSCTPVQKVIKRDSLKSKKKLHLYFKVTFTSQKNLVPYNQ